MASSGASQSDLATRPAPGYARAEPLPSLPEIGQITGDEVLTSLLRDNALLRLHIDRLLQHIDALTRRIGHGT